MAIPKVIHYCWFGKTPLPKSALKCIESWKKYLPDYEIKRWDESNFDVSAIPYTSQAYEMRKYAFVSDYARFWILYKYGGLYFDTDVEVIRSMDDVIEKGAFMGCEGVYKSGGMPENLRVAPGLGIGAEEGMVLYKDILEKYQSLNFTLNSNQLNPDTVVNHITNILCKRGLKNTKEIQTIEGVMIYPSDYFCPISIEDGKLRITQNTRSIHHYDQTWQSPVRKYGRKIILKLGGVKLKRIIQKLLYK